MRLDEILVRAVHLLHEAHTQRALAARDGEGLGEQVVGAERQVGRFAVAIDAAIVAQQRHALAVDGDIDVLDRTSHAAAHVHADLIDAVGREGVLDHHAAARAVGGAVDLIPRVLRGEGRGLVEDLRQPGLAVPNGHAAHRRRGVEVALEQRGGERLHVGDVVEVGALLVEGQPVAGGHVEPQQIAHHALVLGTVEPLEGARARIDGARIHGLLQRFHERQEGVAAGALRARRGHHLRAQLANDLFGGVALGGRRQTVPAQVEIAAAHGGVVAGATVLLHRAVEGGDRHAARAELRRGTRGGNGTRQHRMRGRHAAGSGTGGRRGRAITNCGNRIGGEQ